MEHAASASDWSSAPAPLQLLSQPSAEALRYALYAHTGRQQLDGSLRGAAQMVCVEARRRGLTAERMLVLLKRDCATLPEIGQFTDRQARADLIARFVTLCIEEFYAGAQPPGEHAHSP